MPWTLHQISKQKFVGDISDRSSTKIIWITYSALNLPIESRFQNQYSSNSEKRPNLSKLKNDFVWGQTPSKIEMFNILKVLSFSTILEVWPIVLNTSWF